MDEKALQELVDKAAIERVLYDYCSGIDRCDEEMLLSVYHPDAYDDHGVYKGDARGFVAFALKALKRDLGTQHLVSNVRIDLDGDKATCESYLLARHFRETDDDRQILTYAGRYLDHLEKRDGKWAISNRLVVVDWDKVESVEHAPAWERFTKGGRYPDDPAWDNDKSLARFTSLGAYGPVELLARTRNIAGLPVR